MTDSSYSPSHWRNTVMARALIMRESGYISKHSVSWLDADEFHL